MNTRNFVEKTAAFTEGPMSLYNLASGFLNKMKVESLIIPRRSFKWKVDMLWGALDSWKVTVCSCQEILCKSVNVYPIKLNRI